MVAGAPFADADHMESCFPLLVIIEFIFFFST